jgi:glycosyltransferase involved in cell wall biosynthesis
LIRKDYYNCLAVAIPTTVKEKIAPFGSTVVIEAMAMGKPIISTRNDLYPFSLEKEKIGFEVDFSDVEGWKQCVNYLIEHPDETKEMGERAKFLCKKKYNYEAFAKELVEHIIKLNY